MIAAGFSPRLCCLVSNRHFHEMAVVMQLSIMPAAYRFPSLKRRFRCFLGGGSCVHGC